MEDNNILAVVLAGGKSKRYGEDKNHVKLGNKTLLEHVLFKISNKFQEILKANGLKVTEAKIGDVFDAEIHEAITQIPSATDADAGKIINIVETGYQLGDRIIRYPKVVVGQ